MRSWRHSQSHHALSAQVPLQLVAHGAIGPPDCCKEPGLGNRKWTTDEGAGWRPSRHRGSTYFCTLRTSQVKDLSRSPQTRSHWKSSPRQDQPTTNKGTALSRAPAHLAPEETSANAATPALHDQQNESALSCQTRHQSHPGFPCLSVTQF